MKCAQLGCHERIACGLLMHRVQCGQLTAAARRREAGAGAWSVRRASVLSLASTFRSTGYAASARVAHALRQPMYICRSCHVTVPCCISYFEVLAPSLQLKSLKIKFCPCHTPTRTGRSPRQAGAPDRRPRPRRSADGHRVSSGHASGVLCGTGVALVWCGSAPSESECRCWNTAGQSSTE